MKWSLVLLGIMACHPPGPSLVGPAGQTITGGESNPFLRDSLGREWSLCSAPGYLSSLCVGQDQAVTLVPQGDQSAQAVEPSSAQWLSICNPCPEGFLLDLAPDPQEVAGDPSAENLVLALQERWPGRFDHLDKEDVQRAAQEALAPDSSGGLLWQSNLPVPSGASAWLVPPGVRDWSCDQSLVWTPLDAAHCQLQGQTSGVLPPRNEFTGKPWVVAAPSPGSAILWAPQPSSGWAVLADLGQSQRKDLTRGGALFEGLNRGAGVLAICAEANDGSVALQVVEDLQVEDQGVAWLGHFPGITGAKTQLRIDADLEWPGGEFDPSIGVEVTVPLRFSMAKAQLVLDFPLPQDDPLVLKGLPQGAWDVRVVAPATAMLEGKASVGVQVEATSSCSFNLTVHPAVELEVNLAPEWSSRGPHLLTLYGIHGRIDMSLDLREGDWILWNSEHRVPLGDYLAWMRPRAADPRGQSVAYTQVKVDRMGGIHLSPEPGLVLVEKAAPDASTGPRGKALLMADPEGKPLDPPLRMVPRRRSDRNAATELLSAEMILLDAATGERVFNRGVCATGYSVE